MPTKVGLRLRILPQAGQGFVSSDPFASSNDRTDAPPPPYESVVMHDGVSFSLFLLCQKIQVQSVANLTL